jgi:predicted DNA-binding transcriptional regulator
MEDKDFFDQAETPRREMLKMIRAEVLVEPKQPDEFTVREIIGDEGVLEKTMHNRLMKLVREGKMTRRKGPDGWVLYRYIE